MTRILVSLAALALLAGCGTADPSPAAPDAPDGPSTPTTAASSSAAPSPSSAVSSTPPSEYQRDVRLVADVLAPADGSGCVAVRSDVGVRWALSGPAVADLAPGDRVDVVGSPRPGGGGCGLEAVLAVERVVVTD